MSTSHVVSFTCNSFKDHRGDVTTCPEKAFEGVRDDIFAGRGTTWPATQVGLRRVKAGLGGHDAGVWGVDEGVEKTSLPISKRGRPARSDYPTFSEFAGVENNFGSF